MNTKLTSIEIKKLKAERKRFLSDLNIKYFNDELVKIISIAVPIYLISKGKIISQRYDSRSQEFIDRITNERDEYINATYELLKGRWKFSIDY